MNRFWKKLLSFGLIISMLLTGLPLAGAVAGDEEFPPATGTSLVDWNALLGQEGRAAALPEEGTYAPHRLLVTHKDDGTRNAAAYRNSSIIGSSTLFSLPMPQEMQEVATMNADEDAMVTCTIVNLKPKSDMLAVMNDLSEQEGVLAVEFDRLCTLGDEPTNPAGPTEATPFAPDRDPLVAQQTWLDRMGATKAWDMVTAKGKVPGAGVVVAVLDTGITTKHPDLKDNIEPGGLQFSATEEGGDVVISDVIKDGNGHGTHVSGIIAGAKNGTGITGVAYGAKILPIKVVNDLGQGYVSSIIQGMLYAAGLVDKNGTSTSDGAPRCQIANMSLGADNGHPEFFYELAIDMVRDRGILVVVAAGNEGTATSYVDPANPYAQYTAPAYIPAAFTVMAMQETPRKNGDYLTYFSNWDSDPYEGAEYALMAPGSDMLSSLNEAGGYYGQSSGTSMSSPAVAGAAALVLSANPGYGVSDLWSVLATSGKKLQGKTDAAGEKYYYHTLDVAAALNTTPKTVKSAVKGEAEGYWTEAPGFNIAPVLVLPIDGSLPKVKLKLRGFDNTAYGITASSHDLTEAKGITYLSPGEQAEMTFTLKEMPDLADGCFETAITINWLNRDGSEGSEIVEVMLILQQAARVEDMLDADGALTKGGNTIFVIDEPTTIDVNIPKKSAADGDAEDEETAIFWNGLFYFTDEGSLEVTGKTELVLWGAHMLNPQLSGNVSLAGATVKGTGIRGASVMDVKKIEGSNIDTYPRLDLTAERIEKSTIAHCVDSEITAGSIVNSTFAENYDAMGGPVTEPLHITVTDPAYEGSDTEDPTGFYGNAVQGPVAVYTGVETPDVETPAVENPDTADYFATALNCYYLPAAMEGDNEHGLGVAKDDAIINVLACAEDSTVYIEGESEGDRPAMLKDCPAFVISTKRVEGEDAVVLDDIHMKYQLETEFSRDISGTPPMTQTRLMTGEKALPTTLAYKSMFPPYGNSLTEGLEWADDGKSCTYWVHTAALNAGVDDFYALTNLPVPVQYDLRNPIHNKESSALAFLDVTCKREGDGFVITWDPIGPELSTIAYGAVALSHGTDTPTIIELTPADIKARKTVIPVETVAPNEGTQYSFTVVLTTEKPKEEDFPDMATIAENLPATGPKMAFGGATYYEPYETPYDDISLRDSAGNEFTTLNISGTETATFTLRAGRSFHLAKGLKITALFDSTALTLKSVEPAAKVFSGVAKDGDHWVAEIAPTSADKYILEGQTIATLTFQGKNVSHADVLMMISLTDFFNKNVLDKDEGLIAFSGFVTTTAVSTGGGGDYTPPKKDTTTQTLPDGTRVTTSKNADGSIQIIYVTPDGVKSTVKTPAKGESSTASISLPKNLDGKSVRVAIPMPEGSATTVAVLVGADGKEQVLPTSVWKDGVLTVPLTGSANLIIRDNAKTFSDIKAGDWFAADVAFVTSRELFQGTGKDSFAPNLPASRAMLFAVLQRLSGEAVAPKEGETWYDGAMVWAKEKGISDGTAPMENITRQQLAAMLYRYAGSPAATGGTAAFADSAKIADWAQSAMDWAVKTGILRGTDGNLNPEGQATRAEVAAMLTRFVTNP